jgi:phenylpropionate dioxygenase-like ring-hydroxylating dioxygenase large terminal subunit
LRAVNRPLLPPFPNGWYALSLSRDLAPGAVRALTFMGQDIVLFRTRSGEAAASDAYCPHLGAHLGYGGEVIDECIRCPFHGFRFDARGDCTHIPYGTNPPPLARLQMLHVRETHGLILAHHDGDGRDPSWEVPSLDMSGWSPMLVREWRLRGHPQETTENSVDLGHFSEIHGYSGVEVLSEARTDGPYLTAKYAMVRVAPIIRRPIRAEFEVHVHALGHSHVEVEVPAYGMRARLFVLPTPIDGEQIVLRVALSMHPDIDARCIHPAMAYAPKQAVRAIMARFVFRGFVQDVEQDFVIWKHKRYVQPPILAAGDGPVGKYRTWAKQFYTSADVVRV